MIHSSMIRRVLLTLGVCAAAAAHAAVPTTSGALTVSPAVVTMKGTFGQSTVQRVSLTNGTSQLFVCDILVQDVIVQHGRRAFANAGATPGSIAATAVVSARTLSLQPGESAAITVTLTVPQATNGRAVVVLFHGTKKLRSNRTAMFASIGSLMTFALSDDVALHTGDMSVKPPTASTLATFAQTCVNGGREPLVARGVVAILDANGALVGKSNLDPRRLLPAEQAEFRAEYPGDLKPGHYRVMLTYGFEGQTLVRTAEMDVK
jgi:hypothetical protein